MTDIIPDACSLPTAERPLRLAEFDDLLGAVRRRERLSETHLRLTIAEGMITEDAVRDLTRREAECCSFFDFAVSRTGAREIRLDIEVSGAYANVLDALEERAHA